MNFSCPICIDSFVNVEHIYSLKCGHVFHQLCITNWLVVERSCPKCRAVVADRPTKLYLELGEVQLTDPEMANRVDSLKADVVLLQQRNNYKDIENAKLKEKVETITKECQIVEKERQKMEKENQKMNKDITILLKVNAKQTKDMELKEKYRNYAATLRSELREAKKQLTASKKTQILMQKRVQISYDHITMASKHMQTICGPTANNVRLSPVALALPATPAAVRKPITTTKTKTTSTRKPVTRRSLH